MSVRKKIVWTGGAIVLFALTATITLWILRGTNWIDTPGAEASVSAAQVSLPGVRAEGRVITYPGGLVDIGTEIGGTVAKLHVREGDLVKKGDILVEFDDSELRAMLAEAKAAVHASNARAGFHVKETRRLQSLKEKGAVPQRDLDRVRSERNASFGDTAVALSTVKRIEASIAKTVLHAPIDGTVISCMVEESETRPPGAQLLTIANLNQLRIEAEVDEFDVARVVHGAPAVVSAEGFDETWNGVVEDVPGALVNKGLKPRDPSRPVDIRVLRVKIGLTDPTPLKLGQRVEVRILPKKESSASPAISSASAIPPSPNEAVLP